MTPPAELVAALRELYVSSEYTYPMLAEAAALIESQQQRIAELEQRVADCQRYIRNYQWEYSHPDIYRCCECGGSPIENGHHERCLVLKLLAPLAGDEEGKQ